MRAPQNPAAAPCASWRRGGRCRAQALLDTAQPYIVVGGQRAHSLHEQGVQVIRSMEPWAQQELPRYLKAADHNWQPTQFLPDASSPDFYDQVLALRQATSNLPLDYLVSNMD